MALRTLRRCSETLPVREPSIPTSPQAVDDEEIRRRVLLCTPFPPRLDARHGGKATAQLLARLALRHDIALLYLRTEDDEPVDDVFIERCAHVEGIPLARRRSSRSAALQRARWAVGFARGLPPWAMDCRSARYRARLRALADEWRPDVVEIHLQVMAQYASALDGCPASRVLVDYDPPSVWAAELASGTHGIRRLARRIELGVWRRYEKTTRTRFAAIVVFAERDIAAVAATAGGVPIVRIPLAFELPEAALDPVGSPPPTIVFVGGFRHPPNVDAARWLAESIFPAVRERVREARLELVGDQPGDDVLRLAGGGVTVHGSVPDVTPHLNRAAVVVAPLRLGGSMRGKVLEALGAGKALVATPTAAEGVEAVPGEHFVLAETQPEIADALSALLLDPDRRRRLAEQARRWALENLSWEPSVRAFEHLYESLAKR
jgi:glycosyltransferase involved in cell wall biosynthesis